jgi:hypothetical protein
MPRTHRTGPIVIDLSGERAHRLAERLLASPPGPATERLLEDIARLGGRVGRLTHDWDPSTGRLTLVAGR